MKKIFIYSSTDGQSQKICEFLKNRFDDANTISIDQIDIKYLKDFDHLIIGASVRYGDHNKKVY